jgi:hypothetical protein
MKELSDILHRSLALLLTMMIRPNAAEVRAITEEQAERMIEMNDDELHSVVRKYAEDFGPKAAAQLERYVRRQQHSR